MTQQDIILAVEALTRLRGQIGQLDFIVLNEPLLKVVDEKLLELISKL